MNTFYFNNKTERVEKERPSLSSVYYTEIETDKDYDKFMECFVNCRFEGYSITDSIDWAR